MKKIILTVTFAVMSICALAQSYQPSTKWPLVYENFVDGAIRTRTGSLIEPLPLNVSVADASLMYGQNGVVMKADMSTIFTARVGEDVYVNVGNKLYKVLVEADKGWILQLTSVDIDKMNRVDIGYGVQSTTASSMNVNSLVEASSSIVNMRFDAFDRYSKEGAPLALSVERYIYAAGQLIQASKSALKDYPGIDKKDADAFIKANKIKWSKPESLAVLIDFVAGQFQK